MRPLLLVMALLYLIERASAGPLAYATCQTACNAGAVLCYAKSGLVFGTVTIGTAPAGPLAWAASVLGFGSAAALCSAAQGTCMAACTPLLVAPTP